MSSSLGKWTYAVCLALPRCKNSYVREVFCEGPASNPESCTCHLFTTHYSNWGTLLLHALVVHTELLRLMIIFNTIIEICFFEIRKKHDIVSPTIGNSDCCMMHAYKVVDRKFTLLSKRTQNHNWKALRTSKTVFLLKQNVMYGKKMHSPCSCSTHYTQRTVTIWHIGDNILHMYTLWWYTRIKWA